MSARTSLHGGRLLLATTLLGGAVRVDAGHPKPQPRKAAAAAKKAPKVQALRAKSRPVRISPRLAAKIHALSLGDQIVVMTNQARLSHGLKPLAVDPRLAEAAQIQAEAMAATGIMAHDLPGMPLPMLQDRLHHVGYPYGWAGENLGMDCPDVPTLESLWLASPEHRRDMLLPYFTATGVGVAFGPDGEPYYAQVFASSM